MEKYITIVAATDVPKIAIISGIILLFLALVGRFGTYVEIPPKRQNLAIVLGLALLSVGILLYVYVPGSSQETVEKAENTPRNSNPSTGDSATASMWILAGSYVSKSGAEKRQRELASVSVSAIVGDSDRFDFVCPGFFSVVIPAPELQERQALLDKIRQVEPAAFFRNPKTFDPSRC